MKQRNKARKGEGSQMLGSQREPRRHPRAGGRLEGGPGERQVGAVSSRPLLKRPVGAPRGPQAGGRACAEQGHVVHR